MALFSPHTRNSGVERTKQLSCWRRPSTNGSCSSIKEMRSDHRDAREAGPGTGSSQRKEHITKLGRLPRRHNGFPRRSQLSLGTSSQSLVETPHAAASRKRPADNWPRQLFSRCCCPLARFAASPHTRSRTSRNVGTGWCAASQHHLGETYQKMVEDPRREVGVKRVSHHITLRQLRFLV